MRILRIAIIWLLISQTLWAQQSQRFPAFEQAPLRTVLSYLEENYGLIFSYRDTNLDQQEIHLAAGNYPIDQYLNLLFEQTRLQYEIISKQHVILSLKSGIDYRHFCAYVKDRLQNKPLAFATISIKNKNQGTNTTENGWFELHGLAAQDSLVISYIGYHPVTILPTKTSAGQCPSILLDIAETAIPTVEVKEYLTDGIGQKLGSQSIQITPDRLSLLPGNVEPDIMSSIQILPGVFSPTETASNLFIRGGTPDQNLVLWDDIPLYHTGHFFGMISAFNPYIVEEVDVYRSGIGSEFGGRVSGVIDIRSKEDISRRFQVGAGFNLTHGHLNLNAPLWKNSAIQFSFRRSFTDSWPTPTFLRYAEKVFQGTKLASGDFASEGTIENSDKFYFSDGNFKWTWKPGKNKFGIVMFGGENQLNYLSDVPQFNAFSRDLLQLRNGGANFFWERDWGGQFSTKVQYTLSEYDYDYQLSFGPKDSLELVLFSFNSLNRVRDEGFNWINEWKPGANHSLKFGYQFSDNQISLGLSRSSVDSVLVVEDNQYQNKSHTLFGDYRLFLANVLELNLGLRYQRQVVLDNDYFEPRIALSARINDQLKVKISSSKQFQFISQLILLDINDIGINNQIWIASDNIGIPVIESNQWTGGLLWTANGWTLDLEGYVKELAGITSLSNSFGNLPDQPFSRGNSRIRGIDVLLKKRHQNYRTWVSYTLSKAVYEFLALQEAPFPAAHDQRHALQWVHLLNYRNWEFSVGWQFRTGLPYTAPDGIALNQNNQAFLRHQEQNAERLKPYHRLDASVLYHFGKTRKISGFTGLSFLNIYNHENYLERRFLLESYDADTGDFEIIERNTIGLRFTPNVVLRLQW
ncbi:MAG: TonB-dependent receptor [Bacteroidota bacterium]